jgi:8-oxo-dGTP pyrophosphatase MutT (NUDIX family)
VSILSSLRDFLAPEPLTKATSTDLVIPQATTDAMDEAGMDWNSPFSPGRPMTPSSGVGGEPRRWNYASGYNIVSRADRDKRVSFDVLKGLIDNYDIARMAIGHRIDDVRSLDWTLVPSRGFSGDIDAIIAAGYAALKHPEGPGSHLTFRAWSAKFLEDVLRYDAGCLFRRRDRAGRVIGLKVVSGRTIAPVLDYWGDTPSAPAPAFVQFVNGTPWKQFTANDLIYSPFRPQPDSAYGFAPLESVLLTANTDLRFQLHFLNSFTDGNVPEGFMSAPEGRSTPDQLIELQDYWDALLYGDQAAKHQMKMVPFGTTFDFPSKKEFDEKFPIYLMRKVAAAYHVTPNDLGFTDDVNRSTSEAQVDVQFRIGTLPLVQYLQDILSAYLQEDLGLPLDLIYDTGQETDDRLSKAQAHKIYIEMGVESPDEVRAGELGLEIDNEMPVPRGFFSTRTGWVPLVNAFAIAGPINPGTMAPADDLPLQTTPFEGTQGIMADKLPGIPAFKRAPINPDEPNFPELEKVVPGSDQMPVEPPTVTVVAKSDGVTSETGIEGVDLIDDEELEKAAFRRFVKARRKAGTWRDFEFNSTSVPDAHALNQSGRAAVRKAAGEIVAAGLCVQAADTGRVLMIQRAYDETDPAGGQLEFPGGHIEGTETPQDAAIREWCEETGLALPVGAITGGWEASNGVYVGFVLTTPTETAVPILNGRNLDSNPDIDGDMVESISWWDPALLANNPIVRNELAADMLAVLGELAGSGDGEPVAKGAWEDHPVRTVEAKLATAYAEPIASAISGSVSKAQLQAVIQAYIAANTDG